MPSTVISPAFALGTIEEVFVLVSFVLFCWVLWNICGKKNVNVLPKLEWPVART